MKKLFKIYMLLLILILLFFTTVNASNINMNLQPYDSLVENNAPSENTNNISNETVEPSNEVSDFNTDTVEPSDEDVTNTVETPRITSITTSEEDNFFTVENILSIAIIVIGILLILLAIAILIRLK